MRCVLHVLYIAWVIQHRTVAHFSIGTATLRNRGAHALPDLYLQGRILDSSHVPHQRADPYDAPNTSASEPLPCESIIVFDGTLPLFRVIH